MKKILTIIGARPQIIKAAAMSRVFQEMTNLNEIILHTGQHYDRNMSEVFFQELKIPKPNYNLASGSGERKEQIKTMIHGIMKVIEKESPDLVLVYGDTNSTLAGATAGYNLKVPVAHIEAGLRSFNEEMPEERNRILTDKHSTFLFCPTEEAIHNLKNEDFSLNDDLANVSLSNPFVQLSGDIMLDNTLYFSSLARKQSKVLEVLGPNKDSYLLATCHRPSNTDNELSINAIFRSLLELSSKHAINIVLPIHPRTQKMFDELVESELKEQIKNSDRFKIIDPVSFLDMVSLEANAKLIITDSGGVQKEAFFLGKPCLVLREETEWVELVENGNAILCGANQDKILKGYEQLEQTQLSFPGFYGDGKSSNKIAEAINTFLNS